MKMSVNKCVLPALHTSGLHGHRAEVGGDGPLSLELAASQLHTGVQGALPALRRAEGSWPRSLGLRVKLCFLLGL